MEGNVLHIDHVTKDYGSFCLQDLSLQLPAGCIMGLVGENGAGKSTLIKLILNMLHADHGSISVFGMDYKEEERKIKEEMGVVFSELNLPDHFTAGEMSFIMSGIYQKWDPDVYASYLKRMGLVPQMKLKAYSRGMKMKLSIAMALSHHARLLLLDEPTSGLDPVVRDEILDILMEFIQDESCSVLISSHIISDLEKTCDYIAFLHQGRLLLCEEKDRLLEQYKIIKCSQKEMGRLPEDRMISYRENAFGVEVLVKREDVPAGMLFDSAGLEEVMIFFIKGKIIRSAENRRKEG